MTEVKRLGTETEQVSKHGKLTVAQTNSRAELEAMTIDDIHMQEQTWKQLNPQAKLFMEGIRTKAATKKADESRMRTVWMTRRPTLRWRWRPRRRSCPSATRRP